MSNIVSLFDMTGNMVRPLANKGYDTFCYDIQNEDRVEKCTNGGSITFICADVLDKDWQDAIIELNPIMLFAFPPCTDLAVSGAKHFDSKLTLNPNYRVEAMNLVYVGRDLGDKIGCPYMIENPISVISSEWRKPDFKFHPYEYGGYLPEGDVHPEWPEYIVSRDAYTKNTCIWAGNGFKMPTKIPVSVPEGLSTQYTKLGGKSLKTKNIRSATPRGYALAVATQFNNEQYCPT